jgi:ankyrin repeat protein
LNTRFVNELLDAAKDKNYIRVEEFFQKGRGTLSNREGTTCLHVAANVGSKRIIKLCLRNGMDLDTRDLRGRTPLHYLVEGSYPGQEVLLEYLVSKGSRRNAVDVIGNSILAEASRLDHLECVISLIAMSVDVNSQDIQGFTPIHVAAASNAWASVKALIGMGHADVDLPDYEGCTPLHDVCAKGYSAVLSLLLPHVHNMNVQDYQGMTPLHHAINGINEECVRIFLENGGNTEIQDHFGTFPIHLTSQDNRRCHILTMLCESFTHLDVVDNDNQTALHLACIANVPEVVTILLGFGAEPNVRDSSGCQPIHLASRHGSVECCQILFDYNVDINIKNYDGISALATQVRMVLNNSFLFRP